MQKPGVCHVHYRETSRGFSRVLGREAAFVVHDTSQKPGAFEMLYAEHRSLESQSKCMGPLLQRLQGRITDSDLVMIVTRGDCEEESQFKSLGWQWPQNKLCHQG